MPLAQTKKLKAALPAAKPSGVFTTLRASSLNVHSGILCLDYDEKDNRVTILSDVRDRLKQDPHVLALHATCRGAGLAVFVAVVATGATDHKASWRVASAYFRAAFNLNEDRSCGDVGRNRYVSFDPDTWWRDAGPCERFSPDERPEASDPSEHGCPIDYGTCPTDSKNEFSSSPSDGLEKGRSENVSATRGTDRRVEAIERLYTKWVGWRPAVQGTRNAIVVEVAPILLNIVGRSMGHRLLMRFYDEHASAFTDPRHQHEREVGAAIAGALRSYPTTRHKSIALTPGERRVYLRLNERAQDVFRITRSLARADGGRFTMGDAHLGYRLGCDKTSAARALEYLVRDGVLELLERGEPWRAGMVSRRATRYRWISNADSQ